MDSVQKAEAQEVQQPNPAKNQDNRTLYIIKMGKSPDECIVSNLEGVILDRVSINELDMASLGGKFVVDLSLSEEKKRFFAAISRKLKDESMDIGIACPAD